MKKTASLFTLLVFLGTSFLTPLAYAQTPEMGISDVPADEEFQNGEENDITETYDTGDEYSTLAMEEEIPGDFPGNTSQRSGTMFIPGGEFNLRLKSLANDGNYYYYTNEYDGNIREFKKSETPAPDGFTTTGLATDDSEYEIRAWYDDGIIYYYTDADIIYLNPDSGLMFQSMEALTTIDTNKWDTSTVTDMRGMFADCRSLKELNVSNWDTSNTNYMGGMFYRCLSLKELDVSEWDTSKVTNMGGMFADCSSLKELDVSEWDTSKVIDMGYWRHDGYYSYGYYSYGYYIGMFAGCISLKELDVSEWNTSNVTNMENMFSSCISLKELDVSEWDTSNVINMEYMFASDVALMNLDVSKRDTSKVTNMRNMFAGCINLTNLNLSNWDTSNVTDMEYMFGSSDSLETIYVSDKFVTNNVSEGYDMFRGTYNLIGGNGTKYDSNYIDYGYANIDTDQTPGYFTNISGNTVIVRFFTNGGLEVNPQVVSKGGIIESVTTTKENAVFKGWYTDEGLTRSFKTSTPVNSNLKLYAKWECVQGYYDNKGQCIDENKKIEKKGGVIKITDGEKTVYIKDRNQGATQSKGSTIIHKIINPILQKYKNGENLSIGWLYRYVAKELSEISGEDMFTLGELFSHYDNDAVKLVKDIKAEYEAGNYLNSFGNYYYWGNNTGVSYDNLGLGEIGGSIDISYLFGGRHSSEEAENLEQEAINLIKSLVKVNLSPEILSKGFTGGKFGEENTGWEKGNTNNPCDSSKGEYLPTLQDWVDLMQVWGNINGYELVKTEQELGENSYGEVYVFGSGLENAINNGLDNPNELLKLLNLEITEDIMVPGAGLVADVESFIRYLGELQGISEEEIENAIDRIKDEIGIEYAHIPVLSPLWIASDSGDTVGIYIGEAGLISVTNDIGKIANSMAMPVRCFVDESAWSADEEQNNNYSGGGGRGGGGGGSSTPKSEPDDTRLPTDEEKNIDNDKKQDETKEIQENTQEENKSDTTTPQNNQGNKGTKSESDEFQQAYNFAHKNGITTKNTISEAKMNGYLTRIQMAKMLSQYAMNTLGKEPDLSKGTVSFNDVTNKMDKDYNNGVTLAYQLGIMGQNMPGNNFRPNDEVTRAEFVTALSRLLYSTLDGEYKGTGKYYVNHMEKLKEEGIITKDDPSMREKRGYVMVMLMRSVK